MTLYSPGGLNLADTTAPLILAFDATGTTDVVFAVSASGDLTITPDGGDVTVSGTMTVTSTLTLTKGSQNYFVTDDGTNLAVQSQTAGSTGGFCLFTKDGDGTDSLHFRLFAVGLPGSTGDNERLNFKYKGSTQIFELMTSSGGTGVDRPLHIYVANNTSQLVLNIDGSVSFSGAVDITGALTLTVPLATAETVAKVVSVTGGTGIDSSGGENPDITFDGSELVLGGTLIAADHLVAVNGGVSNRQVISSIPLGIFNNDQNWSATTGTVTSVASGDGLSGGPITGSGTLTVDSTVIRTTGTQTISGAKTFTTDLTLTGTGSDIRIAADARFYFDGGTHTYITEEIADRMDFVVGGLTMLQLHETTQDEATFGTGVDVHFQANVGIGEAPDSGSIPLFVLTSATGTSPFIFTNSATGSNPNGGVLDFSAGNPNNTSKFFLVTVDSVETKTFIWSNGDLANRNNVYGAISDRKFKMDETPARSQWEDIKKLGEIAINYRNQAQGAKGPVLLGWAAQDVEAEGMAGLVQYSEDLDGTPYLGLKSSIISVKSTLALAEALVRIETAESEIAELKAA